MRNHARKALIALLALMFILSIIRLAEAAGPSINLPPGTVNATFIYPGPTSYWKITLSSVPSGYDVANSPPPYVGWCCDQTFTINNGATLGVKLYSSCDPLQPWKGGNAGWNKVNYIINNKQGTADDVQAAIWHYIDSNGGNQGDPDVMAMESAADASGGSFVPMHGQLLAVVLYLEGSQTTFIEVTVPTVQLTVTSAYDTPTPTSGPYTPGTSITASVTSPVAGSAGTQYVCTGWTGSGDVPATGTGTAVSFTITHDSSITWNWKTRYLFTVASAHDTPTPLAVGSYWIDANTGVAIESVVSPTDQVGLTRYRCTGYTGTGDLASGSGTSSPSFTITQPTSVTFNWVAQYYLTVKTDPSGLATIPGEGWYDAGAKPTLTAPQFMTTPFLYWDVDGVRIGNTVNPITVTMSAAHTATADYYVPGVGGEWAPIDTVHIVTPWVALAFVGMAIAAAGSHRLLKKRL